ncbi:MAG: MraY family glycosyltransferase [bacterium]
MPNERKVHKTPVPLLGGLAVFCSFCLSLFFALLIPWIRQTLIDPARGWAGLVLGSLIIIGLGFYDDCRNIKPGPKIFFQSLAAGCMIIGFGFQIRAVSNPFGEGALVLGWLSIPFTFLWVVGITNALNIIDGLDGLASGVAAIAGLAIFTIACTNGNPFIAFISLILVGNVLGFLVYNFHPASIFLGDSGSLFIGFWLSFLSVQGVQSRHNAVLPIAVPVMVLGFPIMDMTLAVLRRFFRSERDRGVIDKIRFVFKADQCHIHHKLLDRGFSQRLAVVLLYCLCLIFAGCALCTVFLPRINHRVWVLFLLASCLTIRNMTDLKTARGPHLYKSTSRPYIPESDAIALKEKKG